MLHQYSKIQRTHPSTQIRLGNSVKKVNKRSTFLTQPKTWNYEAGIWTIIGSKKNKKGL